jgi:hypothetical protein
MTLTNVIADIVGYKEKNSLSQEIIKWCFSEGYKIYPVTKDNQTYQVEVSKAHQIALLDETHTKRTIHQAVKDVYIKLYNKQNNK